MLTELSTAPVRSTPDLFRLTRCPSAAVEQVYATRRVPRADGSTVPMDVFIPREEGDFLYSLVRHLRPEVTVEVGMAYGLSTLFIAEALRDNGGGRHIAIDPFQWSDCGGAGVALVRSAGLEDYVKLVELPSHQALPDLERAGVQAGFVFVDGSHLFDYVLADFLAADRILRVGGVMAFDDSDWEAVEAVLRYAVTNRHYAVAHPEVVIERPRHTPTLAALLLRGVARRVPALGAKLRPDFLTPSFDMGLRGRCVALRKTAADDRDSQSRFHRPF